MKDLPHRYRAQATADAQGTIALASPGLPAMNVTAPPEFGGPENYWSPETLLTASIAACFILTFRAVARASSFSWESLDCEAEGLLDRSEGALRFTEFALRVRLSVPRGTDGAKAQRLLEKAEKNCLIASSLRATMRLEAQVEVESQPVLPGAQG